MSTILKINKKLLWDHNLHLRNSDSCVSPDTIKGNWSKVMSKKDRKSGENRTTVLGEGGRRDNRVERRKGGGEEEITV